MEDFVNLLQEYITDEGADEAKYMKLADMADEKYNCGYGQILRDIAHEESIHKKHLEEILADIAEKE